MKERDRKKGLIIITGSAGRIGAKVAARLGEDFQIVGFELMKAIYASNNEELVPMDISSDESVLQAFKHIEAFYGKRIVSVIHLAAYYSFSDLSYEHYKKITVDGTERLLKVLQNFDVEQFIFSSTMLMHAPAKIGHKINENSPLSPSWAYPKSKIETEKVIHTYRGKIPVVMLRIAGVYDSDCNSIPIGHQIQRIYENQLESYLFPGDLRAGAAFVHMDDVVDAICLAVEKRKELPKEAAILIGEPVTLSTDQLQRMISFAVRRQEMKTWRIPKIIARIGSWIECHIPFMDKPFIRPWMIRFADDNYELDISKARRLLGWEPKYNLEEELPKMVADLKRNPKKWYAKNHLKPSKAVEKQWDKQKKKSS